MDDPKRGVILALSRSDALILLGALISFRRRIDPGATPEVIFRVVDAQIGRLVLQVRRPSAAAVPPWPV